MPVDTTASLPDTAPSSPGKTPPPPPLITFDNRADPFANVTPQQLEAQLAQDQEDLAAAQTRLHSDQALLAQLILAVSTGNIGLLVLLLTQVLRVQEDNMNILSATQNVATDYRQFNSAAQSAFQGLANLDPSLSAAGQVLARTQIVNMSKELDDLKTAVTNDPNLDPEIRTTILGAINDINTQSVALTGFPLIPLPTSQDDLLRMAQDFHAAWTTSTEAPGPLKSIVTDFQTINQAVSSLQGTLNTKVQFATQTYNTYLSTTGEVKSFLLGTPNTTVRNQLPR